MLPHEQLFLRKLEELEACIVSDDWYELLTASAILRMLLLDSHPLVDQVNAAYRLKLRYEILEVNLLVGDPKFAGREDGFDPATAEGDGRVRTVTRDEMLGTTVLIADHRPVTLREVILFEANVAGGVHSDSPKHEKAKALAMISELVSIMGQRPSLNELRAAGRVVLRGLAPLRAALKKANP